MPPWSYDVTPQEVPPSRLKTDVYALDSTHICTLKGPHSEDLACLIVEAVNLKLKETS